MNLRLYLRFLRPLRSLGISLIYADLTVRMGQHLLHLDRDTSWLIALAVVLPHLLGVFIAGAAHEPMHRPFALLLPNLRRRQRKLAAFSVLIAALAVTRAASWAVPIISPVATFGLACGLIALPCIDRYQLRGGVPIGGLAAVLAWILISMAFGAKLAMVMNASPWLFLIAGLAICAASLARGFSRESLRARADIVFSAPQTIVSFSFFQRGTMARWRAEQVAQKNRRKKSPSALGRDWTMRTVCTTTRDWMRVFWHAKYGAQKRGSFLHVHLRLVVITLVISSTLLGVAFLLGQKNHWVNLDLLVAPDERISSEKAFMVIASIIMLLQPVMALFCSLLLLPPQLAYPLSRARLAQVVFWQAAAGWATALTVPAGTLFFVLLFGQTISGVFLPGFGLPALLAVDLALAVLLPLLVAAVTIRRPILCLLVSMPIVLMVILLALGNHHWSGYVLSLPGVVIMLVAAAASLWLLWHRLRRHYIDSDMVLETGFVHPFAVGTFGLR